MHLSFLSANCPHKRKKYSHSTVRNSMYLRRQAKELFGLCITTSSKPFNKNVIMKVMRVNAGTTESINLKKLENIL